MRYLLAASACVALLAVAEPSASWASTTTINVELTDSSTAAGNSGMVMTSDHPTVKAGWVRFHVVNKSTALVHEMIIAVRANQNETLPYDPKDGRIIEKKINRLGEVSDLQPGKAGTLRLTLKPGPYLLFCNQPGHYEAGMKTPLTVTR